jgi:hypothetical protein
MEPVVDWHAASILCWNILVSLCCVQLHAKANVRFHRYVAMHAMQEGDTSASHDVVGGNGYADSPNMSQRKQLRPQMRDTIATVVGMLLPLLLQFGHHH